MDRRSAATLYWPGAAASTTPASAMSFWACAFAAAEKSLPAMLILRIAGISDGLNPSAVSLLFCK